MVSAQSVCKESLAKIKPTKQEEREVSVFINEFIGKVNRQIKHGRAILGGSGAKGTWLKNAYDADIFVQYPHTQFKHQSDQLSDLLAKDLKPLKSVRLHGSRDYFQVNVKGFTFEIVPILNIKKAEDAVNITDVSPLHAKFVCKYKKYADDIRLAKQFCKASGCYGAESYIGGFSGYALEILVIYYKGFLPLLKNALTWKSGTVIDIKKYHKNAKAALNQSKLISPLIIIDPVDSSRNAAAALSQEKYSILKEAARRFLAKPHMKYFEIEDATEAALTAKYRGKPLLIVTLSGGIGKADVLGARYLKMVRYVERACVPLGIEEKGWRFDRKKSANAWFVLKKTELPSIEIRQGPPLTLQQHVSHFKKKHKNTFIQGNRIAAKVSRKERTVQQILAAALKRQEARHLKMSTQFKVITGNS